MMKKTFNVERSTFNVFFSFWRARPFRFASRLLGD